MYVVCIRRVDEDITVSEVSDVYVYVDVEVDVDVLLYACGFDHLRGQRDVAFAIGAGNQASGQAKLLRDEPRPNSKRENLIQERDAHLVIIRLGR